MKRFKESTIIWVLLFLLIGTAFVFAESELPLSLLMSGDF